MEKSRNWIKDHQVLFFPQKKEKKKKKLEREREREREREKEVLVPVLKISLGSDPVLINLDRFASLKHSILVSILIPQLSDPVPIQVFSYQSEPKLAIRTCLALVLTVASFFLRMGVILGGGGYIHLLFFKSERDPYKEGPSHLLLKSESDPYRVMFLLLQSEMDT